ncbi:hypothetical protein FMEXI_10206 [Fusarium mexicanum]|uniref:Uncharacterized protein n=1 Tax=Fusarium mexicanum TaxID=751941 RepID=A0A8H5IIK9_9HYPO|nr:hypothetical protein FMEXI_10206 [Fusarium mexicanum]
MYMKLVAIIFLAALSLVLSGIAVPLSKAKGFSSDVVIHTIRDNRTIISIIVQVLSTLLALGQTYVVTSLINLATNARLLHRNPPTLDRLKLLQAITTKSPILDWGSKRASLISVVCLLLLQLPAALWAGSITPTINELTQETLVQVPDFDQATSKFWASQCAPAQSCDELLGETQDLGTFSFVNWKARTGLLANSVSQASSRNLSTPAYQKLDGTGYFYHGRSYGVGSAVGLLQPTYSDDSNAIIRGYSFVEDGYYTNISCHYNRSIQLSFIKSDMVSTPGGIYAPQGYWVHGSLPNGQWAGFPTWGVVNEGFTSSIAAVNNQSRYMYGFLAGVAYSILNQTQCEVWFTPSRFNVSVDMDAKNISVALSKLDSFDIDPSRALANISFHGVGYLSQTLTTLYTSVLGDSFRRNVENVQSRAQRKEVTDQDVFEAVEDGIRLLLDHFLEGSGAAQVMLLRKTKPMSGTITVQVFRVGAFWPALSLLIISTLIAAAVVLLYCKYGLWGKIMSDAECDFIDFKSAILGSVKGLRSEIDVIKAWNGQSEDRKVGQLRVRADRENSTLTVGPQTDNYIPLSYPSS